MKPGKVLKCGCGTSETNSIEKHNHLENFGYVRIVRVFEGPTNTIFLLPNSAVAKIATLMLWWHHLEAKSITIAVDTTQCISNIGDLYWFINLY